MSPKTGKSRKKSTQRKNKSPVSKHRRAYLKVIFWFTLGLLLGLGVPWWLYLNHLIKTRFEEHHWHSPSLVFAAPLNIYESAMLSPQRLAYHLQQLGYRPTTTEPAAGEYRHWRHAEQDIWRIHTRGFAFTEGQQGPLTATVYLADIDGQWQVATVTGTDLLTLEPVLLGGFYSASLEQRQPAALTDLPNTLVQGIQAVEDRQFKHHHGLDLAGIARAAWRNLLAGRVVQGGSTITQQLVKNRLRMPERSWLRKLNEAALAVLLEQHLDKGKILQDYLNEVYWGQAGKVAIHGIAQASEYYFGLPPERLDLARQALLIGLIKGPSWYNPRKHPERALKRRNLVLRLMAETGIVSEAEARKAASQPLGVTPGGRLNHGVYSDFLQLVRQRLRQRFSPDQLQQAGLRIFTTLDPWAQQQLGDSLATVVPKTGRNLQAAAVLTRAHSGEILALDGGVEQFSGFNRALLARRQIGSLIKPFIYLAGLELLPDFDLESPLPDKPVSITTQNGTQWRPNNFSGQAHGDVPARKALLRSWNLATVNLGLRIGLQPLAAFLNRLGLQTPKQPHPSLLLGAVELSPLEAAQMYQLLASSGAQNTTVALRAVTTASGRLLLRPKASAPPAVDPVNLRRIRQVLHEITETGTAAALRRWPRLMRPLFGKTGTSNGGRDNWFAGFDRHYLLTIWVGRDDNKPTGLTGARAALPVWAEAMQKLQRQ